MRFASLSEVTRKRRKKKRRDVKGNREMLKENVEEWASVWRASGMRGRGVNAATEGRK